MPLYPDALIGDTMHLSVGEFGAYMLILVSMWSAGGSLPNDDRVLRRISRVSGANWTRMRPTIMALLTVEGDRVTQRRLRSEFDKAAGDRSRRANAGRKGGVARAENAGNRCLTETTKSLPRGDNEIVLSQGSPQTAPKPLKTLDAPQAMLENGLKQTPSETQASYIYSKERETYVSPKKAVSPKRGTRIEPDWQPSEIDRAYAASKGASPARIAREAEAFRNYWLGVAGEKGVKLDWPATWRNWILNGLERRPEPIAAKTATGWSLPAQSPGRRA
jgi:uncharacterized protein YdaU (DUF1376 family)